MVGLIDTRSPKVYELMTAIKRTDISPISAESWTEHLQSHFVQPQKSAPDLLSGQFNLPARHQLLSGQLRSGQILPSDIAVPPGPGGRYRNMNTTFQRSNERAPVYELPPYILWLPPLKKTFQTWTHSPAQVLTLSLLLLSNTQKKQFGMIAVRVTLKTCCFPFLLTCSIYFCQTVSPHIFGTKLKLRLYTRKVQLHPHRIIAC